MPKFKESPESIFLYWVKERELIRKLRNKGKPKPWTNDPILQTYRFCNVRRMDDSVSQWLMKQWYKPNYGHSNTLIACALARHINLPSTLSQVGFPEEWNPTQIKEIVRDIQKSNNTAYNSAYMVRGIETADKIEMIVDRVIQPLVDNPPTINTNSIEQTVDSLLSYWGFSTFMAGQTVADMRWATPGKWKDKRKWAAIGPGSRRGINRLFSRKVKGGLTQKEFNPELQYVIDMVDYNLPEVGERLEAIDVQNCLCEFDKYMRVKLGEGRPKRKGDYK